MSEKPKTILFTGLIYGKQYRQAQAVVDFIVKNGGHHFTFKIEASDRIKELETRLDKALTTLDKYKHCRHGCVECFCTKEASATLADIREGKCD